MAIAITTMIMLLAWLYSWPFIFGELTKEMLKKLLVVESTK